MDGLNGMESKADAFIRIGEKRVVNTLKCISLIGNLSTHHYEYTEDQIDDIEEVITERLKEELSKLRKRFDSNQLIFSFGKR